MNKTGKLIHEIEGLWGPEQNWIFQKSSKMTNVDLFVARARGTDFGLMHPIQIWAAFSTENTGKLCGAQTNLQISRSGKTKTPTKTK